MLTRSRCRMTAVLLLLLAAILAAPLAAAAAPRTEGPRLSTATAPDSFDLLDRAWSFLRKVWSKEGCSINPNGLCWQPPAQTKDSCSINPDGQCKPGTKSPPPAQTKTSCGIDPSGQCKP